MHEFSIRRRVTVARGSSSDALLRFLVRAHLGVFCIPTAKGARLNLQDLGWDAFFADAFKPYEQEDLIQRVQFNGTTRGVEPMTERGRAVGGILSGKFSRTQSCPRSETGSGPTARLAKGQGRHRGKALPLRSASTRKAWHGE